VLSQPHWPHEDLPQLNNNVIWCFGTKSMEYHCSTAVLVGKAS
jgi:methylamine dehydrogenase light chain